MLATSFQFEPSHEFTLPFPIAPVATWTAADQFCWPEVSGLFLGLSFMYRIELDNSLVESVAGIFGCDPCRAAIKEKLFSADIEDVLHAADMCIEHSKSANGRYEVETYRKVTSLHEVLRYSVFSYLWFLEYVEMPRTSGERKLLKNDS